MIIQWMDFLNQRKMGVGEVWKPIGWLEQIEGVYEISDMGRVRRSLNAPRRNSTYPGRILKPDLHNSGYLRVTLNGNGKMHRVAVHRLVARAFLESARKRSQVNHIDGNKHNNDRFNLEWCTPQENIQHAWNTGLCENPSGEKAHRAKLTNEEALLVRAARSRCVSLKRIADTLGVSESTVSMIDRNQTFKGVEINE